MHSPPPPQRHQQPEEAAWASLVGELQRAVPRLVDDFLVRVMRISAYSSGAIEDADLRETAEHSILLVVDTIADPSNDVKLKSYARELGERRARQGIPAEALTSAVRLNFPLIWVAITEIAGEDLHPLLAPRVEAIWGVLDEYATACYSSYISERMREARHEVRVRQSFISALFSPEGQLPEVQERFGRVFEAPVGSPYAIIAVNGRPSTAMREISKAKHRYLHETDTHSFLFWPVSDPEATSPYQLPTELVGEPCGLVFSPEGLGGLESAAKRATALAGHLSIDDTSPITVDGHWPRVARNQVLATGIDFAETLHRDLRLARPGEAERIRETVESYLRTGSVADTAEQLFTHRNTVLNRLRRFTELTGLDLHIPVDAARVVIAWAA